jgi:DNA-nicking Smr family endonuclease
LYRITTVNGDEIDMHGTKVAEAIDIVKELLLEEPPSNSKLHKRAIEISFDCGHEAKPLKIITGRGNHSVRKTGVLKPAIRNALAAEGWDVSDYDGWVIVRGKR